MSDTIDLERGGAVTLFVGPRVHGEDRHAIGLQVTQPGAQRWSSVFMSRDEMRALIALLRERIEG
jgi:hypothetical protein